MKVISIGLDKKVLVNGSENQNRQLEVGKLVDELHIIILGTKKVKSQKIGNTHIYSTGSASKILYFLDAIRLSRKIGKPDLISAQDPYDSGLVAYFVSKFVKAPLHLQVHIDFFSRYFREESLHNRLRFHISNFLLHRADRIRVVSRKIKEYLVSDLGIDRGRIDVLPVYLNVKNIADGEIKEDLHNKYPQFRFIILMASRLVKQKNIDLALEVMREIPGAGLVIVGSGSEENRLKEKAKGMDNVVFEPWTDSLISYYKTADLFLSTSNYEGWGRTSVEAMAAGCPVVISDVGLANEFAQDGINGLIFPVGNKQKLIEKITTVMKNNDLRGKLIDNAKESINRLMSRQDYLDKYYQSWQNSFS